MGLERVASALSERYRIEREVGQGGMATVYLAHDLRHDRRVALKVLRPELAAILGGDRFLKEIKTTANLQHPHILSLFDSGEVDGVVYYVMPYIEGESLRARLVREKQLPVDDAVRIGREVADALSYAHRHGIIHRDVKPENILLHDGRALVADFGIALAVSSAGGSTRMTETGMSLGTPHYMSPEQAMGEREITARSDVYALACVVYEMLTGEPPFTGPTAQAIVARVLTEEPRSLSLQRKTIPPHVEIAVMVALSKLPADRFAGAAQFGEALGTPGLATMRTTATRASPGADPVVRRWRRGALIASVTAVAAVGLALWAFTRPQAEAPVTRFGLVLDDSAASLTYSGTITQPPRLAISPDGRTLLYAGGNRGVRRSQGLYLRRLDRLDTEVLQGTEAASAPAISPDGTQFAFITNRIDEGPVLKVGSLHGGLPVPVARGGFGSAPVWGPDRHVYFLDETGRAIRRVPAGGGPVQDVLRPGGADSTRAYFNLNLLPDGTTALVVAAGINRGDPSGYDLHAVDLKSGRRGAGVQGVAGAVTATGHLVYLTYSGILMGVEFDRKSLSPRGQPVPLITDVDVRVEGHTDLVLSANGTLAYVTTGTNAPEDFVWISRSGQLTVLDPAWSDPEFEEFQLSPDGTRLAVALGTSRQDIWIKQLDRGPKSRLTFGGTEKSHPAWTPDGKHVGYVTFEGGKSSVWRRRADGVGPEELITRLDGDVGELRWSGDGRRLLLVVDGGSSLDIFVLRPGQDTVPVPLLNESYHEALPAFSPDGQWLAYISMETGTPEVFVRPFPEISAGKWQISSAGADGVQWSTDGRELYFRSADNRTIQVADMARGPSEAGPRTLVSLPSDAWFETNGLNGGMFEVSRDGQRFLLNRQGRGDESGNLVVVQNFLTELRSIMRGAPPR
jgi:Tol biopolymer transport system component/tRNA A-37 threonylcarbamoyl transferase component Bud32